MIRRNPSIHPLLSVEHGRAVDAARRLVDALFAPIHRVILRHGNFPVAGRRDGLKGAAQPEEHVSHEYLEVVGALPERQARRSAFSPDGRIIASSGNDKTVRLWDVATGQVIRQLGGNQDTWWSPIFAPDGKTLAGSNLEGVLCLWDCATGERLREFKGEWQGAVGRLFFSSDGKTLYSWADKKVRVWNTATGKEICQFFAGHADRSYIAAFAPNGKWVACGGQEPLILVYDLASGGEIQRLAVPGPTSCLAFSPDSRTLAWGSLYGEPIALLEMATNQVRHRFAGHQARIRALVFWPDGRFLASGSSDTTGFVWDLMDSSRLQHQETSLSVQALRVCWAKLADLDGATAYDAICKLVATPKESIPFLAQHLRAVPPGSLQAIPQLLADLDNDQFAVRDKAAQELERLGDSAEALLRQALEQKLRCSRFCGQSNCLFLT